MTKSKNVKEVRLRTMIKEGKHVCDIYDFASENDLIPALQSPSWLVSGLGSLKWFTIDNYMYAPHFCFIELMENNPTSWEATKLAALSISMREEELQAQAKYATVVAQNRKIGALGYKEHWDALVKDVASKLVYLTAQELEIGDPDDPDSCLEAIESAWDLSEIFQPAQPFLFVAGIERAYDRAYTIQSETAGGRAKIDRYLEPQQSDWDQRAKVKRMVDALIRLFDGRGKLMFVVEPGFQHFDMAQCARMNHVPVFEL